MSVLPGKPGSHTEQRIRPTRPVQETGGGGARPQVLLAGPEAIALRNLVEAAGGPGGAGPASVKTTESILEAVLMADGADAESRLIIAGVSQELEQIESAVRSLRKVYTAARIVLVCDPSDEVLCRKAKGWGADDYLILPVDARTVELVIAEASGRPMRSNGHGTGAPAGGVRAEGPAKLIRQPVEVQAAVTGGRNAMASDLRLPSIPLIVQTQMLSDVAAGRPDFGDRAVATLQSYISWNGALKFIAAAAGTEPVLTPEHGNQLRAAVNVPGQPPFGALVLDLKSPANGSGDSAALTQAAAWLGSMMSLSRRYEQLRSLAITDELSGAYNRRYFSKFMAGLLERAKVNRFRVTLLLFDIDDFKKYNDQFGHASGDAIIRELIKLLRACTRPHDLVARIGGDEFAVVFWDNEAKRQPNSEHPRDAIAATDRFRKAIKNHQWPQTCNIKGEVSISGGLASFPWDADTLDMLTAKADAALLRAKAAGKNAIVLHGKDCVEEIGGTPDAAEPTEN